MTNEQIDEISRKYIDGLGGITDYRAFAREIIDWYREQNCSVHGNYWTDKKFLEKYR